MAFSTPHVEAIETQQSRDEEEERAAATMRATQHILMRCGGRRTVWPSYQPDADTWEVGGKHPHLVSCLMQILDSAEGAAEWAATGSGADAEGGGMTISATPPTVNSLLHRVVLLDDDWRNIDVARKTGASAVHLKAKDLPLDAAEAALMAELEKMYTVH